MKFNVTFKTEECKGCGLCTAWCKKNLIALDRTRLNKAGVHPAGISNQEECVGCLNCAMMCPDSVITIERIEE